MASNGFMDYNMMMPNRMMMAQQNLLASRDFSSSGGSTNNSYGESWPLMQTMYDDLMQSRPHAPNVFMSQYNVPDNKEESVDSVRAQRKLYSLALFTYSFM